MGGIQLIPFIYALCQRVAFSAPYIHVNVKTGQFVPLHFKILEIEKKIINWSGFRLK